MVILEKINPIESLKRKIIRKLKKKFINNLNSAIFQQREEIFKLRKKIKILNKERINIVFVCHCPQVWGSLKTVFEACNNDESFNVTIVAIPTKKRLPKFKFAHEIYENSGAEEFFKNYPCKVINGYNYETKEWFDLKKLEPDYLFFQTPYNIDKAPQYNSAIVSQYANLCYIPYYAMPCVGKGIFECSADKIFFINIDILFCESESIKKMYENLNVLSDSAKIYVSGFPRFDNLTQYENTESKIWTYNKESKKFRIIWIPRWETKQNSHFFDYKDKFLQYADENKDIELVFRPHPLAFSEYIATGQMSEKEVDAYKSEYLSRTNAHIDFEKEYLKQFYSSDVLVFDTSSIVAEYFLTGKPIVYCHRDDYFTDFSKKLSEGYYWTHNWDDIVKSLYNIKNNIDPLKEKREQIIKSEFFIPKGGGGAGNRIKDFILKDFNQVLQNHR
jgi:hypothetical protein